MANVSLKRLIWEKGKDGNVLIKKGKPVYRIIKEKRDYDVKKFLQADNAKDFLKSRVEALIDDVFDNYDQYSPDDKKAVVELIEYINNENVEKFEKYDKPVITNESCNPCDSFWGTMFSGKKEE